MAQWGNRDQLSDAPKFNADDQGNTGQDIFGATPVGVFGVDDAEAVAARGDGKGGVQPGWVLRTEGTGGRAGRVTHETLVAMSGGLSGGDAVDFVGGTANTTGTADDVEFPDV